MRRDHYKALARGWLAVSLLTGVLMFLDYTHGHSGYAVRDFMIDVFCAWRFYENMRKLDES